MRKTLVTTIAVLTTAMLFNMTSANASIYKFTFQSSDAELTELVQRYNLTEVALVDSNFLVDVRRAVAIACSPATPAPTGRRRRHDGELRDRMLQHLLPLVADGTYHNNMLPIANVTVTSA